MSIRMPGHPERRACRESWSSRVFWDRSGCHEEFCPIQRHINPTILDDFRFRFGRTESELYRPAQSARDGLCG